MLAALDEAIKYSQARLTRTKGGSYLRESPLLASIISPGDAVLFAAVFYQSGFIRSGWQTVALASARINCHDTTMVRG